MLEWVMSTVRDAIRYVVCLPARCQVYVMLWGR